MWSFSIVQLCITHLSNFLQLIRVPAFTPYIWFCLTYCAPLQSVFLILTFLQHDRDSETENMAFYFVDEVINFFLLEDPSPTLYGPGKPSANGLGANVNFARQNIQTLRMLQSIRQQLGPSPELGQARFKQAAENQRQIPTPSLVSSTGTPPLLSNNLRHKSDSFAMPVAGNLGQSRPMVARSEFATTNLVASRNGNGHTEDSDVNMILSPFNSESEIWSASMAQDVDGYLWLGQESLGKANPSPVTPLPTPTRNIVPASASSSAAANLEGSLDFFSESGWISSIGGGNRTTRNGEAPATRQAQVRNDSEMIKRGGRNSSGAVGVDGPSGGSDGYASSLGADLRAESVEMTSEELWEDF